MGCTVQSVIGPVNSGALGLMLPHEHVFIDERPMWHRPSPSDPDRVRDAFVPVSPHLIGRLRGDPLMSLDNLTLLDESTAVVELTLFRAAGGQTVGDMSCRGMGRDPRALRRVAEATGLTIIMGTGYYMEPGHPPELKGMSVSELAQSLVADLQTGCEGTDIRAGHLGEIGISGLFTEEEEKSLRGAARAQAATHVPIFVHLPGWERYGHRVLDIIAEEGGDLRAAVLCHMNPSLADPDYQTSLADRGAWIEYDMIGMDYYYADCNGQSPCDEENATAIVNLMRAGYADQLLLSSDMFLKMMLVRHGGFGYAHVITNFAARLRRHGLDDADVNRLMVSNPRRVYEVAASGGAG